MSEVINLQDEKIKRESIFRIDRATQDIEAYTAVISKSLLQWSSFSVQEKADLYATIAMFNVEILRNLVNKMKGDEV